MPRKLQPELKIKSLTLQDEIKRIRHEKRRARAAARHSRNKIMARDPAIKRRRDGTKPRDYYERYIGLTDSDRARVKERLEYHDSVRVSMHTHDQNVVRPIARAIHIAYCLMKGRDYHQIEQPHIDNPPNWNLVRKNLERFGFAEDKRHNEVLTQLYQIEKGQTEMWRKWRQAQSDRDAAKWAKENPGNVAARLEEAPKLLHANQSEFQKEREKQRLAEHREVYGNGRD